MGYERESLAICSEFPKMRYCCGGVHRKHTHIYTHTQTHAPGGMRIVVYAVVPGVCLLVLCVFAQWIKYDNTLERCSLARTQTQTHTYAPRAAREMVEGRVGISL